MMMSADKVGWWVKKGQNHDDVILEWSLTVLNYTVLKGGELYVLSLLADAQRCVRGFHFDRAAGSVLTTCLSVCHDNYLFLGSRLGKHYIQKNKNQNYEKC